MKSKAGLLIVAGLACLGFAIPVNAAITVTYHLDGVDSGIASQIRNSVDGAIGYFQTYGGSLNKQLNVYYSSGVPTAQANWDGVITFGGSRNLRVAMHEILHTLGVGTTSQYESLMTNGTWDGPLANTLIQAWGQGTELHGDTMHIWPYGLNYDSEDSETARRRCAQLAHALQCDMGFGINSPVGQKRIVSRASGKCIDVSGQNNSNMANVEIWSYWGGSNQKWTIANIGGNRFSIRSLMSGGRCLDCGWSPANGSNVYIYDYWGGDPQKWQLLSSGGDYFRIDAHLNTDECLDTSTSDGANVGLWSYWGGSNQQWLFLNP